MNKIISKVTSILSIHLNIGQSFIMNTSEVFMSFETTSVESLPNKQIDLIENAHIHLPSTIKINPNDSQIVLLRVCSFVSLENDFIF